MRKLTVGEKVYVVHSGSWSCSYHEGTVVKTTPTGYVDVQIGFASKPTRFKPDGREMGASYSYAEQIDDTPFEERKAQLEQEQRAAKATAALQKVHFEVGGRFAHWGKEELQKKAAELQAALDEAKQLIEAI